MQYSLLVTLAFCMLTGPTHAGAQTSPAESESKATPLAENGVPIDRLIAMVAKKPGKKSVVDPRVRANIIIAGEEPSEISYPQILTVLEVYGFIAVDDGGLVRILPDASTSRRPSWYLFCGQCFPNTRT